MILKSFSRARARWQSEPDLERMPDRKPESLLVIINGKSNSGKRNASRVESKFALAGISVRLEMPGSIELCHELIDQESHRYDGVVIGGGDGSLHAAAPALLRSKVPFGILPLGTANDLGRSLKIPRELNAAIDVILQGKTVGIHLGLVNDVPFFNGAHIGLGVEVNRKLSRGRKKYLGAASYASAAISAMADIDRFEYEIIVDGITHCSKSVQLLVGNGRYYGGRMKINHRSDLRRPELFLYSIESKSLRKIATSAPRLVVGRYKGSDKIFSTEGTDIQLYTDEPKTIFADGESVGVTPAHFRTTAQKIRVYSPLASKREAL